MTFIMLPFGVEPLVILLSNLLGGAENAGVKNAGVEKAGVDSRSGKCRSVNIWKVVRRENSKIPVVYAKTKRRNYTSLFENVV